MILKGVNICKFLQVHVWAGLPDESCSHNQKMCFFVQTNDFYSRLDNIIHTPGNSDYFDL